MNARLDGFMTPLSSRFGWFTILIPGVCVLREVPNGRFTGASLIPLAGVLIIPLVRLDYSEITWLQSYLPWLTAWCLLYF
jgi:hypothetical protein